MKTKKQTQTELRLGGANRSANNSAAVATTWKVASGPKDCVPTWLGLGLGLGLVVGLVVG